MPGDVLSRFLNLLGFFSSITAQRSLPTPAGFNGRREEDLLWEPCPCGRSPFLLEWVELSQHNTGHFNGSSKCQLPCIFKGISASLRRMLGGRF